MIYFFFFQQVIVPEEEETQQEEEETEGKEYQQQLYDEEVSCLIIYNYRIVICQLCAKKNNLSFFFPVGRRGRCRGGGE